MKLATIPFTNAAPFYHRLDPVWLADQTLVRDAPRDLGLMARRGEVDAGLLSLVDLWDLEKSGEFEPLGNLGVAARGAIRSILLFGCQDPLALEGQPVAVSGQTSTSARLLDVWLRGKVGLKEWKAVELGEDSRAALLIADQALARRLSAGPADADPIDLCERWTDWTGLPFVFARWAVRKDLPAEAKASLLAKVEASLDASLNNLEETAEALAGQTGFPAEFLRSYLGGITYRLESDELAGLTRFKSMLEES